MFKFGFSNDNNEEDKQIKDDKAVPKWLKSEEILIGNNTVSPELLEDDCTSINTLRIDSKYTMRYVSSLIVAEMIRNKKNMNDSIFKAEQNHSDLVPAIYEGGLKIWECTYDLLDYIYTVGTNFKGMKVLDLGCGAGIIGIFTFLNAAKVYFQDYNPEVLKYITVPNVLLNCNTNNNVKDCRFYSGDWNSFLDETKSDFSSEDDKFDYIFTSETIYNCDNYEKLHLVFENRLKRTGNIFLAAKTYYFGVGGGTRQFEDILNKKRVFKYESCWKCDDGVKREIMKISFK